MTIKEQIDQDIKQAMLGGDKVLTTTLRGLKSAILYAEVAKGSREQGLTDAEIIDLFSKEAKKRTESADLYKQGGNEERAAAELEEKIVIERYLPQQLSDEELRTIVANVIAQTNTTGPQAMGKVIGAVKAQTKGSADGAKIASITKELLAT